MSERSPAGRPPRAPRQRGELQVGIHRNQPARVVRSSALAATNDIISIVHREVGRMRAQTMLSPADVRTLLDLARTAREARQLEQLVEDELGDELGKLPDAELEERT